jgi:uncharacterized SAM-binding protein YcdF (DUF218 family)
MKKGIRLFITGALICFTTAMLLLAPIVYHAYAAKPQKSDVIVVLGCQIWGRSPSLMLKYRLEEALSLYRQGYAKNLIVSGGQGNDEITFESSVMKQWLVDHGVETDAILEESRSTSTYENLKFSLVLMNEHSLQSATLVTSDFHIYRSLMLAARLGIKASGAPSPSVSYLKPYYYARETLSVVKSFFLDREKGKGTHLLLAGVILAEECPLQMLSCE